MPPKKAARPNWRDHWDDILNDMADGGTLRHACRKRNINHTTILAAITSEEEGGPLADQYARARAMQGEAWASGVLDEADAPPNMIANKHGESVVDPGWVQYQRLRVDARKWLASKVLPKQYGDRVDVTSGGEKIGPIAALPPSVLLPVVDKSGDK